MEESGGGVRLHVGGLGVSVGKDDLLKIFSPMGTVDAVEFVRTKGRSFAYIDFSPSSNNSLTKLFSTYNGCVWKGGRLRLEKAKEHYLARLKREWEEKESSASDNTIKAPSDSTPSTHLNMFFPRLRKVKALPLSGTGKHKYSFQRVPVPSLPKIFCDCEEHSNSLTPRETHVHDLEALNVGINEDEVNVMKSVMNKLFQKNNIPNSEQVPQEDSEIDADQDNLIINVVSSGNDMGNSELDMLSRKRKSILNEPTASGEGYTERGKGNHIHPSKKRQSIILEEGGRQKSPHAIPEKKKPSVENPVKSSDEPSRTTGVKPSSENISWSQKSSWKALMANGNSSDFNVSSFLPGVGSSKAVQLASRYTDLVGVPSRENLKEKTKSKCITSTIMAGDLPVSDDTERDDSDSVEDDIETDDSDALEDDTVSDSAASDTVSDSAAYDTASDAVGSDHLETFEDTLTVTSVEAEPLELVASTEGRGESGKLNVEMHENIAAEDLNAEKESLVLKDNVVDEEEAGKGSLKACEKSTGGSSWLQKASWTQLVSDKSTSFSITQLFPDLNSDKGKAAKVINNEDGQYSNSTQSASGLKQMGYTCSTGGFEAGGVPTDSTPVRSSEENQQSLSGKNVSAAYRLGSSKKIIRRKIGSSETCTFMRSSASLKEWAKAKKALSEPRRKKKSEE